MLKSLLTTYLVSTSALIVADSHPGYPPNPYEIAGGKRAPAFSEANAQAIHWLNLADALVFEATWLEAGGVLRDVITQRQWAAAMEATRLQLGPVHSRVVASHAVATNLPYGTRGNFMIIKYNTQFQRMSGAVETVILMTEGDFVSEWKVIGYRIENR